jgi:predicted component of type VI protein secretion system
MSHQSLNRFLGACRLAGPLVLQAEAPNLGKFLRRSFDRPFAVVGRDPRCDLPLEDEKVSQRHLYLQVLEGCALAVDLSGSPRPARPDGWMGRGEIIAVGPFQVRIDGDLAAQPPPADGWDPLRSGSLSRLAAAPVAVEFRNGNQKGNRWQLDRTVTLIGRTGACPLQLVHASVSKTHCSLLATGGGLWIIDLLGRGGVSVNDRPVRWACLEDGDTFTVGEFELRVRWLREGDEAQSGDRCVNLMRDDVYLPAKSVTTTRTITSTAAPTPAPTPELPATRGTQTTAPTPFGDLSSMLPAEQAAPGSPERLLMMFAQQFTQMQQQMFDQFQQSITMMVTAFSSMHRDQVALVREELDQLRDITERLHTLEMELARQPETGDQPTIRLENPRARGGERNGGKKAPPPQAPSKPAPAPRPPEKKTAPRPTEAKKPAPATGGPQVPPNQDVHAWLTQQIETLKQERQSVWQKLMSSLTGKGGEL